MDDGEKFSLAETSEGNITSVRKHEMNLRLLICFCKERKKCQKANVVPLCIVLQVGSVNPAENFRTLVQKKTIPFDQGEL